MLRGEDEGEQPASPTARGQHQPKLDSSRSLLGGTSAKEGSGNGGSPIFAATSIISVSTITGSGPNPAAQASWFLAKDPDPMMQALLENMLAIESSLLELRMKSKMFQESAGFVCRTMNDQANCYARLCKDNATLASSTTSYAAVTKTHLQENAFNRLCETLELKVYEPINVNLTVLGEIKARAHERDAMRRRSKSSNKGPVAIASPDFAALTARLFDELAALQRHRYDFIRGLYEGLKAAQRRFFTDISTALESPDLDVVRISKVTPPLASRTGPTSPAPDSTSSITRAMTAPVAPVSMPPLPEKPREVIVATPLIVKFDPAADQVKPNIAPAFSRFKNAEATSKDGDRFGFEDVDEEDAWSSKVSSIKLPPATKPITIAITKVDHQQRNGRAAKLGEKATRQSAPVNEDDDSDFDTV